MKCILNLEDIVLIIKNKESGGIFSVQKFYIDQNYWAQQIEDAMEQMLTEDGLLTDGVQVLFKEKLITKKTHTEWY